MELTEAIRNEILLKVLESNEFKGSSRYQDLLKYLVEMSSKSDIIKETEIAVDFFGKDSDFDPSTDPIVRSYISSLRKKLEHYYLTTTDGYEFRLEIPKGHYVVKFTPVVKNEEPDKNSKYQKYIYPGLVFLLSVTIILLISLNSSQKITSKKSSTPNPIWAEFLAEDASPTLIVIGEYLFLSEKNRTSGRSFTRVPSINSEQEFNINYKKDPNKYSGLEISEVTYIGAAASLGSNLLMQELSGSSRKITVKLSHEIKWDDIENYNIIYIGTFKTLYTLDTLFSKTNVRYHLRPNKLDIIDSKKDTVQSFNLSWVGGSVQKDYSIILKRPSSKKKTIMFLLGFSEVGVMEAVKSLIDKDLFSRLSKFSSKFDPKKLNNFEMILEAEGLRYSVLGSQIKYLNYF